LHAEHAPYGGEEVWLLRAALLTGNFFNFNVPPNLRTPARPFTAVGTLRFVW
jgi:hypothetical protein